MALSFLLFPAAACCLSNNPVSWCSVLIDAAVVLLYFLVIVGVGLYAGRRNKTLAEFALGGRALPWWAVLASLIAAEVSAATFLGTPALGYKTHAFFYAQLAIGTILAPIVIAA